MLAVSGGNLGMTFLGIGQVSDHLLAILVGLLFSLATIFRFSREDLFLSVLDGFRSYTHK